MDTKKIILWIAVIIVAGLSMAAVAVVISGHTPGSPIPDNTVGRFTAAVDEERVFPADGINDIQVKTVSSDINIIAAEVPEIKAHLYGKTVSGVSGPVVELAAQTRGSILTVEAKHRPNTSLFGNTSVTLDIYVPDSYSEDIRLQTVSGDIAVSSPQFDRLNAKSISGDIETISLDTTETIIETTSGRVRLRDFTGKLDFESISGSLDAQYSTFSSDIRAKTVSGSIELELPDDAAFTLEASTVSGDIDCGFPVTVTGSLSKRGLTGTVGNGDNSIILETVSGNTRIFSRQ